jgi:hypothetical protein
MALLRRSHYACGLPPSPRLHAPHLPAPRAEVYSSKFFIESNSATPASPLAPLATTDNPPCCALVRDKRKPRRKESTADKKAPFYFSALISKSNDPPLLYCGHRLSRHLQIKRSTSALPTSCTVVTGSHAHLQIKRSTSALQHVDTGSQHATRLLSSSRQAAAARRSAFRSAPSFRPVRPRSASFALFRRPVPPRSLSFAGPFRPVRPR